MASFESGANKHNNLDANNQPKTKQGREKQYAERIQSRKEYAEQSMTELLNLLSEKLGREVTVTDLATDFGEVGADINKYFELVMTGRDEMEMTINHAHLIKSVSTLKLQTEISH